MATKTNTNMGTTLSTTKAMRDTDGMTTDIQQLEKRIKKLKPVAKSILASHVWFNLCDSHTRDEMAGIKSMIKYSKIPNQPEVVEDALIAFGFSPDYAEVATKSQRTLKRIQNR